MGPFALLCYACAVYMVLKKGWVAVLHGPGGLASIVTMGLVSGLVGFCIHGVVESMPLGRMIMFWVACGLIIRLAGAQESPEWTT